MSLKYALYLLPGLIIGLTLHEFAHAWSASLLGDDYARRKGRVSLNPLRHLSLAGTAVLFLLGFGWARPVPVNVYNFRYPKRDYLLTSLAGPAANLLIVLGCGLLMLWTRRTYQFDSPLAQALLGVAHAGLLLVALINGILAALNLLPVPPLDGSKIWPVLIPGMTIARLHRHSALAMIVLVVLLFTNQLGPLFNGVVGAVVGVLPVSDAARYAQFASDGHDAHERADYAEAERHYSAALAVNRRGVDALRLRASARCWLERWAEALADLDRAIALDAHSPEMYRERANILRRLGREEEALRDDRQADQLQGRPATTRPDEPI